MNSILYQAKNCPCPAEKVIEKLYQCGDISSRIVGEVTKKQNDNIFLKVK